MCQNKSNNVNVFTKMQVKIKNNLTYFQAIIIFYTLDSFKFDHQIK